MIRRPYARLAAPGDRPSRRRVRRCPPPDRAGGGVRPFCGAGRSGRCPSRRRRRSLSSRPPRRAGPTRARRGHRPCSPVPAGPRRPPGGCRHRRRPARSPRTGSCGRRRRPSGRGPGSRCRPRSTTVRRRRPAAGRLQRKQRPEPLDHPADGGRGDPEERGELPHREVGAVVHGHQQHPVRQRQTPRAATPRPVPAPLPHPPSPASRTGPSASP